MKTKAFIYIILAGIFWGTSPLFRDYLDGFGFSSVQMTATRAIVTALVLGIYVLMFKRTKFKIKLCELFLFFFIGISYVGTATCYFESMQRTSAATAVVLMYIAPIIVMLYSVFFFGERFTKLKLVSLVSMIVGCFLVAGIIGGFKFDGIGLLIGVASGLLYSAYNIFTKIAMRRGSAPESTTFYAFLVAAISAVGLSFIEVFGNNSQSATVNIIDSALPQAIPMLILMGIVTCVAPYFLYTLAMRDLSAGTASSLGIIEPMAATVFSMMFLHQVPDAFQIVGIVLILGAVAILGLAEREKTSKKLHGGVDITEV